jgi:hypothetical protein
MQNTVAFAILFALQLVNLVLRRRELNRMGRLVHELHGRGMHDAATIARRTLLPNELPTWEQIELMKRDGWPGPKEPRQTP